MQGISIVRFDRSRENEWNEFLPQAKNATFLFNRSYMDYHADRFVDHSLLIYLKNKLVALFPANEAVDTIQSHGGLSYGGLIVEAEVHLEEVLSIFYHLVKYYNEHSFSTVIYKCFPAAFSSISSFEDQFALFALNAKLIRRDTNCILVKGKSIKYQERRKQLLASGKRNNFQVTESNNADAFWNSVLSPNLKERFGASPVHTVAEMNLLMSRFPDNIKLFEVRGEELLAGAVMFVFPDAVHAQYMSANASGRDSRAMDVLVDHLIQKYSHKSNFSFGTSNNSGGPDLNVNLLTWKEGFGARTQLHDFYEIATNQYSLLAKYE